MGIEEVKIDKSEDLRDVTPPKTPPIMKRPIKCPPPPEKEKKKMIRNKT